MEQLRHSARHPIVVFRRTSSASDFDEVSPALVPRASCGDDEASRTGRIASSSDETHSGDSRHMQGLQKMESSADHGEDDLENLDTIQSDSPRRLDVLLGTRSGSEKSHSDSSDR